MYCIGVRTSSTIRSRLIDRLVSDKFKILINWGKRGKVGRGVGLSCLATYWWESLSIRIREYRWDELFLWVLLLRRRIKVCHWFASMIMKWITEGYFTAWANISDFIFCHQKTLYDIVALNCKIHACNYAEVSCVPAEFVIVYEYENPPLVIIMSDDSVGCRFPDRILYGEKWYIMAISMQRTHHPSRYMEVWISCERWYILALILCNS